MEEARIIGKSVPRKEGRDKVTGAARYIDDMTVPGMLYGATVRSQIPRGVIKHISFDPQFEWNEFVVVTAQDIPGKNCIALIGDDQPCLADGKVNHPEEPILLLAHADPHLLRKAVDSVSIEYELLPALFTIEDSERRSQIIWGMGAWIGISALALGRLLRGLQAKRAAVMSAVTFASVLALYIVFRVVSLNRGQFL